MQIHQLTNLTATPRARAGDGRHERRGARVSIAAYCNAHTVTFVTTVTRHLACRSEESNDRLRYRGEQRQAKPPPWNSTAGRGTIDRQPEVDPLASTSIRRSRGRLDPVATSMFGKLASGASRVGYPFLAVRKNPV